MQFKIDFTTFILKKGDITKEETDAIVNAANSSLLGGGGVDGAIHRAGGPAVLEACRKIRSASGSLPTGEAVITTGGNLAAKHVIHTVGPVYRGGNNNEPELLRNAYYNSLKIGAENKIKTIAFPSISTGIYGYPIESAGKIAVETCMDYIKNENHSFKEIRFVTFSEYDFNVYKGIFENENR